MDKKPIISAKDVEITFSLRGKKLKAIRKCSLDLYEGETLAIVGESGSGKSVFTKTFVGMLDANGKITGGSIMYDGEDVAKYKEKDWLKDPRQKDRDGHAGPDDQPEPPEEGGQASSRRASSITRVSRAQKPKRLPSRCWPRLASLTPSAATTSTPMSSPAVCVSVWSSPLQLPAIRRC